MELSRRDKLNLIFIFLTLGPTVFNCKRHKWKYRQIFTVYYFNIPILCLKFFRGKARVPPISLTVPKFSNFIFNIHSDFDLYMRLKQT